MKLKLIILFVWSGFQLVAQVPKAYIYTDYQYPNKDLEFKIKVNGIDVSTSNSNFEIPINRIGFDTIVSKFYNNAESLAILKLKPNHSYILSSNTCSLYEIKPEEAAKLGMVKFRIESKDMTNYVVNVDGLSEREINRENKDDYYYTPPSAMCRFAAKSIEIKSTKSQVLQTILFHFLHGERLEIIYYAEQDQSNVQLRGFVNSEKEYRYLYSR